MSTKKSDPQAQAPGPESVQDDIPLLTDIAPDPEWSSTSAAANALADESASSGASAGEVISRVQAQNLEHSVYQKLRKDIEGQIAHVVRKEFMPEIGSALNSAF